MNSFFARRYVISGIFITIALILLARLFYIQIIDDRYFLSANTNVQRKDIIFPERGPILDRNGKILVQNEPVYDVMVIPKQVKPFDTLELCKLIGIDKEGFDKRWHKALANSPVLPFAFEKQLPIPMYAALQERLSEFPGFNVQRRSIRTYPDSIAAHFLGFIGEANEAIIKKSNGYYRPGDYVGISGVEKSYEEVLRGQRGVQYMMVDSRNHPKGHFANGAYDTVAVAGERLISSLDSRIQKLGERLMKNKLGSIVAIEPSTGEILCFVSSPAYNPNMLSGKQRGNNLAKLYNDPYSPMYARPIQAQYSPGSSFKPLSALIALQEGLITPQTTVYCAGYYKSGNRRVRCTHHHGTTNLNLAIQGSCNAYFSWVFERVLNYKGVKKLSETYTDWKKNVNKFGFGVKLDVDLPNEKRGLVPTALFYDNLVGKNRWRSSTILSLAIGQGELKSTPIQLANIECAIANHGFYYKPHLIKAIGDKNIIKEEYTKKNYVGIDPQYFEPVIDGMQQVVERGTAVGSYIPGINMCGKTGTVQNSHGKNHSVFVAFAPRENPKIAIAVVVENSGDGGTWAAPIASFIVEKYLRDTITRRPSGIFTDYYENANLLPVPKGEKAKKISPKAARDSLLKKPGIIIDTVKKEVIIKEAARKNKKDTVYKYLASHIWRREEDEY